MKKKTTDIQNKELCTEIIPEIIMAQNILERQTIYEA